MAFVLLLETFLFFLATQIFQTKIHFHLVQKLEVVEKGFSFSKKIDKVIFSFKLFLLFSHGNTA